MLPKSGQSTQQWGDITIVNIAHTNHSANGFDRCFWERVNIWEKLKHTLFIHLITHIPYIRYIIYLSHLSILVIWDNIWYLYHLSISGYDRYISWVVIQIGLNSNSKPIWIRFKRLKKVMPHGRPFLTTSNYLFR